MRAYFRKNNSIILKKGSEKIIKYYDCYYDIFEILYCALPPDIRYFYALYCDEETRKNILLNRFNAICLFFNI